ncbi:MAG: hypothetical protein QOK25_181 [Thermoleophilaceae bacterium]|nr:hypothetical protein [Thermoleophilaceae bacterium]
MQFRARDLGARGEVTRGAAGVAAMRCAELALNLGAAILLARALGVSGYGAYAAAIAVANLLTIPSTLGTVPLLVRGAAAYVSSGSLSLLHGLLRRAWQWAAATATAVGALTAAGVLLLAGGSPGTRAVAAAGLLVPLTALCLLGQGALQGLQRVGAAFVSLMVVRPLAFVGALAALRLAGVHLAPGGAMLLQAAATGCALLLTVLLLRAAIPAAVRLARPAYATRTWAASALAMGLNNGLMAVHAGTGVALAAAVGGARDAGLLGGAMRVTTVVVLTIWASLQAFTPVIARLYAAGEIERLRRGTALFTRRVLAATCVVAAIVAALADPILGILGHDFTAGATALRLLCLAAVINAAAAPNVSLLMMTEHERAAAGSAGVAVVLNVALCLLLIPPLGASGAAVAFAASVLLRNAIASWWTWTRLAIDSTALGLRPPRSPASPGA